MKYLILAPPRSGSSALHAAVSEAYDLEWFTEPFNEELQEHWDGNKSKEMFYPYRYEPFAIPDGFVIKCLTFFNHWPDAYSDLWAEGMDRYLEAYDTEEYQEMKQRWFLDYADQFDRVLLLLRRDIGDQLKSMLIGLQTEQKKGHRLFTHWNDRYKAFDPVLDENAILNTRLLFDSIRIIENIREIRQFPTVYYEDLFASREKFLRTNKVHNLGLENMWEKHFDPNKRWRQVSPG